MRRAAHLLLLIVFLFSCGGEWYVLQGIAWARMICDFSHEVPLPRAVEMTLSGEYPCPLCKILAEKRATTDQHLLVPEKLAKICAVTPTDGYRPLPETNSVTYTERTISWRFHADAPPTPPPRLA